MSHYSGISNVIPGYSYHFLTFDLKNVENIQPSNFAYIWLLNKPYENEVTLAGQNLPLKSCQYLEPNTLWNLAKNLGSVQGPS